MQITIKSVRSVKTGTNKKGEWELIAVVSQKGTEYTTFDKKVKHLGEGSVIEIGEPEEKDGKFSFAKVVEIVKEASGSAEGEKAPGPAGYKRDIDGIKAEYDLKAVLQARERVSIEGQSILAEVGAMIRAGFGPLQIDISTAGHTASLQPDTIQTVITQQIVGLYQKAAAAALDAFISAHGPVKDAEVKLEDKAPQKSATATQPAPSGTPAYPVKSGAKLPAFQDGVALVNYALENGWRFHEICAALKITKTTDITDVAAAAKILFP